MLLYATCSILPVENQQQITQFLSLNADARLHPGTLETDQLKTDVSAEPGWQLLPGQLNRDGFYYALLQKAPQDDHPA